MKLLVTGGAGFIGSNFVHYWRKHHPDDSLVVLDKLTYSGRKENLASILSEIDFVEGDIVDADLVNKIVKDVDAIAHFAAEAHVDHSLSGPGVFVQTNVIGTFNLLEAARKNGGKRFHHVSTDEVLGSIDLDSTERWTEHSPYNPRSPYSATKAGSDHLVRAYFHSYGLPVTVTNCANNLGPYMLPERLVPRAICRLLSGMTVPVYGNGAQVREWLDVHDHATAVELVLQKGVPGETYFVGPDNPERTNMEIVQLVLKLMGESEDRIEFVPDRPGHDQKYALDHSKITRDLGWEPEFNLEQTLLRTIEWYKSNEDWWKPAFVETEKFLNNRHA